MTNTDCYVRDGANTVPGSAAYVIVIIVMLTDHKVLIFDIDIVVHWKTVNSCFILTIYMYFLRYIYKKLNIN